MGKMHDCMRSQACPLHYHIISVTVGNERKDGVPLQPIISEIIAAIELLILTSSSYCYIVVIEYYSVQAYKILQKINAFKQHYVCKQELVYLVQ